MDHTRTDTRAPEERIRVLFVCLGNICRSPLAEGVFLHLAREAGVEDRFEVDSAGTGDWHVGERPDPRAAAVAEKHGVHLPSVARQVEPRDFERFDYIVAMDRENLWTLERLAKERRVRGTRARIHLLRVDDPDREHGDDRHDVPDPYYGGAAGFDHALDLIEAAARGLLADLTGEKKRPAKEGA